MVVIICICGPPAAGKTTLFNALRRFYATRRDIVFIKENFIKFFSKYSDHLEASTSVISQMWRADKLKLIVAAFSRPEVKHVVCDTSFYENCIYRRGAESAYASKALYDEIERAFRLRKTQFLLLSVPVKVLAERVAKRTMRGSERDSKCRELLHESDDGHFMAVLDAFYGAGTPFERFWTFKGTPEYAERKMFNMLGEKLAVEPVEVVPLDLGLEPETKIED